MIAVTAQNALEIGKAAEHLVCADLILQGYCAYLTDQGLPYDVVVDLNGRLIRVQVKACGRCKNVNMKGRSPRLAYSFSVRKNGKHSRGRLTNEQCDIVALVALDIRAVAYLPLAQAGMTCQIAPPGFIFAGRYKRNKTTSIDKMPFSEAVANV